MYARHCLSHQIGLRVDLRIGKVVLHSSLRVQRRKWPLSPKAMCWVRNENRASHSDHRQEEIRKAEEEQSKAEEDFKGRIKRMRK